MSTPARERRKASVPTWRRSRSLRQADDVLAPLGQHRRHASHHRSRPAMIVVLAAGAALVAIALVTGLRTRADRAPRLGLGPLPVDDAYTAWMNANSRCAD